MPCVYMKIETVEHKSDLKTSIIVHMNKNQNKTVHVIDHCMNNNCTHNWDIVQKKLVWGH